MTAELPQVTGQHRNHALAAARRARAIELISQGLPYEQVADELGYANKGTVHRLVHQALARETSRAAQQLQRVEAARLDALQVAIWDQATSGDVNAARAATRILLARCRLLGLLDQPKGLNAPWQPTTVVLTTEHRAALGL